MIIVDSSVWIDAFGGVVNPRTVWLRSAIGREEIGLTSLILFEVLQGVRHDARFRECRETLLELPVFETVGSELAVRAAENFRHLRARAVTVRNTIDCILATFCIERRYRLLHNDRDFNAFEAHLGLDVFYPPANL